MQLGIGISTFTEMCGLAPSRVLGSLSYGAGGWATAIFSTTVAAPPATCLEVVLDPAGYGRWNRWIPRVGVDTPAPASAAGMPAHAPNVLSDTTVAMNSRLRMAGSLADRSVKVEG